MANLLLAAFVAFFFWGKASKDVEEKTKIAHPAKILLYFILSFVVGVFFYKSYQVATISDLIDVRGINEGTDTLGNVTDTVQMIINNKFSSGISENSGYWKLAKKSLSDEIESGSVKIVFAHRKQYPYNIIRHNEDYQDLGIKQGPFPDGISYSVTVVSSAIPDLIPVFPSFTDSLKGYTNTGNLYTDYTLTDLHQSWRNISFRFVSTMEQFGEREVLANPNEVPQYLKIGTMMDYKYQLKKDVTQRDDDHKLFFVVNFDYKSKLSHTMDFFKASDISQYIQHVKVNSSCPVNNITYMYDLPIEVQQTELQGLKIGSMGLEIEDEMLEEATNGGIVFLVKLPTLANMQLIRSLILTTLLTALVSLFFLNSFYWLRKKAKEYQKKRKSTFEDKEKIKLFHKKMRWTYIGLILSIVVIGMLVLFDRQIPVPTFVNNHLVWFFVIIVVLLFMWTNWQFHKVFLKDHKKSNRSNTAEGNNASHDHNDVNDSNSKENSSLFGLFNPDEDHGEIFDEDNYLNDDSQVDKNNIGEHVNLKE